MFKENALHQNEAINPGRYETERVKTQSRKDGNLMVTVKGNPSITAAQEELSVRLK